MRKTLLAEVTDHGGNLAAARRQFPHAPLPWLDLSTGINPHPYPFGELPASAFTRLPDEGRLERLIELAACAYGAPSPRNVLAAPGTQILFPLAAALVPPGRAAILSPTYGEHRRAAALAGHDVAEPGDLAGLESARYAVVVQPNNPDGRIHAVDDLSALARRLAANGCRLIVDEAFMDALPQPVSLAPLVEDTGALVLRSFGKFFGLAGIRLGFAIGPEEIIKALRARLGPWAVSGPAIEIGIAALADRAWQDDMRARLAREAAELDRLLTGAGLVVSGGTPLFRFLRHAEADAIHRHLGEAGILLRRFDWDPQALRIGLPGGAAQRERLAAALARLPDTGARP